MAKRDIGTQNPYWRSATPPPLPVRVELSCGHTIAVQTQPKPNSRFGCRARTGCGYVLPWVRSTNRDYTIVNPAFIPAQPAAPDNSRPEGETGR